MARGNGGILWLKRSVNFVEKDPQIDVWRTIYQKERIREVDLAALAGLSVSTVKNMFGGKTRRPQFVTYQKLASATGHKYALTRDDPPDYEKAIPKAREEYREYQKYLAKKREKEARRAK
jgi:hypothetical protein